MISVEENGLNSSTMAIIVHLTWPFYHPLFRPKDTAAMYYENVHKYEHEDIYLSIDETVIRI